jgi:hypothetical protein
VLILARRLRRGCDLFHDLYDQAAVRSFVPSQPARSLSLFFLRVRNPATTLIVRTVRAPTYA